MKQINLIKARNEHNLTHMEIAKILGISRSFYTQIENGKRKPSFDILMKIAKFFNKTVDEIFFTH